MTTTTTTTAPPAKRYESAEEARAAHNELLKELPEPPGPGTFGLVTEFIDRAVATGAVLDTPEDRKQVQGLIDYWAASLLTASRHSGEDGPTNRIRPVTTVLTQFNPGTIRAVAKAADMWLNRSETNRDLVRRVMLRLVRLLADGQKFDPVPAVRATMYDLDTPERVDAVLDALAAVGVVRITKAESPELDRVAVRSLDLTTEWGAYKDWLAERRRFRDAVRAWDREKRPAHALAVGHQLEEARSYFDRDGLEREFLEQSRYREWHENKVNRILKWVFLAVASVAIVATVAAVWGWISANNANTGLGKANHALDVKRQLTDLRLVVRALGELDAAYEAASTITEKDIAQHRWDLVKPQFPTKLGLSEELDQIPTNSNQSGQATKEAIDRIHRFRNPILDDEGLKSKIGPTLKEMRAVSFSMVRLSAQNIVDKLKPYLNQQPGQDLDYSVIEPYVREFWTQYYGEMLIIEGPEVDSRMVDFGACLKDIQADAVTDQTGEFGEVVESACDDGKGKELATNSKDGRLNLAQLDDKAKKLGISPENRAMLQEKLAPLRKKTIRKPQIAPKHIQALLDNLKPLRDALDAEENSDQVVPYPPAAH